MTWLAELYLRSRGWEFTGEIPDVPKLIIIGAPHTTNWDFVLYLGVLHHYRIRAHYLGKHTLFRWPFGPLFRRWGGIPVDRTKKGGIVDQVVERFGKEDRMVLVMAPEGTRRPAPHWKSGFLEIAAGAGVPVLLAYVDYPNRRAGMGPLLEYRGDSAAVMDEVRRFYSDKQGLRAEGKGPLRLEGEDLS